jgi:hypothetical protein
MRETASNWHGTHSFVFLSFQDYKSVLGLMFLFLNVFLKYILFEKYKSIFLVFSDDINILILKINIYK